MASGNTNPGIGGENLFKDVNYLRGRNGARVFYRYTSDGIEILGKANKANEQKVINILKKFYDYYMEKEELDFMPAVPPDIIVKELTEDNIRNVLETYCEDEAYWLKLYYLTGIKQGVFSMDNMNKLISDVDIDLE